MPIVPLPPGVSTQLETVNDLLSDVSFALVEQVVNTTLGANVGVGINTVTPPSMIGIYPGCELIIRASALDPVGTVDEVVIVTSTTATSFTANFMQTHVGSDAVQGATFSSGQIDHPLFTQQEMFKYVLDVQNDFLMKVRPVYAVITEALTTNIPTYAFPVDCIQIERISIEGRELNNIAESDLDWIQATWAQTPTEPDSWYADNLPNATYGLAPPPPADLTAELFYSQKMPLSTTITLLTNLLVPDVMMFILKYGVLARAWSKDGEQRDLSRSAACQQTYDLFVLVAQKFLMGVAARMARKDETVEPLVSTMKT